jgi:hypothetical protein
LLTTPRSLSQRATSFIACIRQGIHQTPFSQSFEIPSSRPRSRTRGIHSVDQTFISRPASGLTQADAKPPLEADMTSRLIPLSRCHLKPEARIQKPEFGNYRRQKSKVGPRSLLVSGFWFLASDYGGADRDRTDDLKLAKLALSQLSYGPFQRPEARIQKPERASSGFWIPVSGL